MKVTDKEKVRGSFAGEKRSQWASCKKEKISKRNLAEGDKIEVALCACQTVSVPLVPNQASWIRLEDRKCAGFSKKLIGFR